MAKSLNRCEFIGHLGQDVETKFTSGGDAVAKFSIACGESYKDKNTGQKVEKTEWINVVAWRKLAEICDKYLKKGSKVYISGKFRTHKWTDKGGVNHWSTEIVAEDMLMLDGPEQSGQQNNPAEHHSGAVEQANPTYGNGSPNPDDFEDISY